MTPQSAVLNDDRYVPVYEHGFVGLVDVMGDDSTPPKRARISYGEGTKSVSDDRNLLRYLIRHKHSTPVEMVELVFHIKLPIFIMRQHVRHRTASINEYSARYSEMSDEMYLPLYEDIELQSTSNKQGREEDQLMEHTDKLAVQDIMGRSYGQSYEAYRQLLEKGVAREIARSVLPVANYTEIFWKVNLHNFFNYARLRRDSHAQKEIREFADSMFKMVEQKFPIACEAFNDYIFEAETFSRMEMNILRFVLKSKMTVDEYMMTYTDEEIMTKYGITKRELTEFIVKF